MATSAITNTLVDAAGQPVTGATIRAILVPDVAFDADDNEIVRSATTTTDADGAWSLALTRQSDITPANSHYVIQEAGRQHTIEVPDTDSTLLDALVTPIPADTGLTTALTQALADDRYVQLTDGVPDGTITDAKVADDAAIKLSKLAVDPTDRANHTGTQTADTISDFTTEVEALVPDPVMSGGMIPAGHGYLLWTFDPAIASADFSLASGQCVFIRCYVPVDMTVSSIDLAVTSVSSPVAGTYSGVGLYTDAGTLLSRSSDAGSTLTTTGVKTIDLPEAQSLTAGTYVWLSVIWQGTGTVKIAGCTLAVKDFVLNAGARRALFLNSQTTLPDSFTPASVSTNNAIHWLAAS